MGRAVSPEKVDRQHLGPEIFFKLIVVEGIKLEERWDGGRDGEKGKGGWDSGRNWCTSRWITGKRVGGIGEFNVPTFGF